MVLTSIIDDDTPRVIMLIGIKPGQRTAEIDQSKILFNCS